MGETSAFLDVQNIEVFYGGIQALHGVSLHVDQGEIVSVIGANGAGKSTLLKTIASVKNPTAGQRHLPGPEGARRMPTRSSRPGSPWCPRGGASSRP